MPNSYIVLYSIVDFQINGPPRLPSPINATRQRKQGSTVVLPSVFTWVGGDSDVVHVEGRLGCLHEVRRQILIAPRSPTLHNPPQHAPNDLAKFPDTPPKVNP